MSNLNNEFYFSAPVEVVKVTPRNLEEVAEWCGGEVKKAKSRKVKGREDSYVDVPMAKTGSLSWAFPGMYITKRLAVTEANDLKQTFAVFRRDYFSKNYFSQIKDAVDATWEREAKERQGRELMEKAIERGHVTINISGVTDISEIADRVKEALVSTEEATNNQGVEKAEDLIFSAAKVELPDVIVDDTMLEFKTPVENIRAEEPSMVEQRQAAAEEQAEVEA